MNMEALQIVIIAALSISTVLITIIGIQLIFILKEVRAITRRVNNISNGFVNISETIQRSLLEISSLTDGARLVSGLVGKIFARHKNDQTD